MRKFFTLIFLVLPWVPSSAQEGLRNINGTQLFVSVKGKGETLVVLHGGPGLNHAYFIPHLKTLEQNFRVIYYDQRASGKSAIPDSDSISIKFLVDDLEAIRKEFRIRRLNLLAHSWGAVLAVHYAVLYPGKINKIILSNPSMLSREYDQEAANLAKQKTSREDSIRRSDLMRSGPMDLRTYQDFFLLSFKASSYEPTNLTKLNLVLPDNFQEANKALFTGLMKDPAQQLNLYNELKRLKFPVLIIHGKADIVPPSSIERLQKSLTKSSLEIFDKSGHFPFIEEIDKYASVVMKFIKSKK